MYTRFHKRPHKYTHNAQKDDEAHECINKEQETLESQSKNFFLNKKINSRNNLKGEIREKTKTPIISKYRDKGKTYNQQRKKHKTNKKQSTNNK